MSPVGIGTSRSTSPKTTQQAQLWLLMVGVNQYRDKKLPSLKYSAIDCQVLATALTDATQQFPQKQVKIYHDFATNTPELKAIRASLQAIATAAQPQDMVLFYFSGHGMLQPSTQQAFLCLQDTQKDDLIHTALPVQELLQLLGKCAANQQLVWLDACHSGGMTLRGTTESMLNLTPQLVQVLQQRAAQSKGFYALLSCDTNQQSWEFPELGHGVFTYYLMRGLQGEAADSQGIISADGLYRYVYHQTLQYIDKTNQQLRLINQQKRGKGDDNLFSEYPLQTPKRIVEGVGEWILGSIPAQMEAQAKRQALVITGSSGSSTTLAFSRELRGTGGFELSYLSCSTHTSIKEIREAIQQILSSPYPQTKYQRTESTTVLLYIHGKLEETPTGESALVLSENIWLTCSWLRQQLRHSQVTQQIMILDCPGGESLQPNVLQDWVEELQIDTDTGQCIIAAAANHEQPEKFAQTLTDTLKAASPTTGLSVAGWITQLQIQLAGSFPLHIWLSGAKGVIEIIPATNKRDRQLLSLDLGICPYQGLQAFGEENYQYFYGRESLTQQLINHLSHNSFLAVVGASGSGKSSVVQAGLIAQLHQGKLLPSDKWLIKIIRPGANPLDALVRRLGGEEGRREGGKERRREGENVETSHGASGEKEGRREGTNVETSLTRSASRQDIGASGEKERRNVERYVSEAMRDNAIGAFESSEQAISPSFSSSKVDTLPHSLTPPLPHSLTPPLPHSPTPSLPHSPTPSLILEGMLYQGVEGFVYWLRSRPEPMVVLVVDQFEELFTLSGNQDRQQFLELLLGGLKYAGDKLKVVITLRADFISPCLEIAELAQLLQESSILVPPKLTDDDYRRVIVKPAEQVGLKIESGLVEVLLQELSHSVGDLPLLQFVLQQLWEHRQQGELTLAAYQQHLGGMAGALERKAQAVYDDLGDLAQECARWIFLSLTQLGEGTEDTRRRVLKSELAVKKYPPELIDKTLQALTAAKLVVVNFEGGEEEGKREGGKERRSRGTNIQEIGNEVALNLIPSSQITVEVAHEILIRHWTTLRWWLEENRSRIRLQRQIEESAALWKHNGEKSDFLLQGVRLVEAEDIYIKYTDELSEDVRQFIADCLEQRLKQQREQKRRLRQARVAIAIISILGLAATGFGGLAYFKQQAAQMREITALNASSAALLLSQQQLESLIASIKAGKQLKNAISPPKDIQLETVATLQQALEQTQEVNRLQGHSQAINAIAVSPNGQIIASASDDNTVKLWSREGKLITTLEHHQDRVTTISFSPNNKFIASGSADKTINIWNIQGKLIQTWGGHTDIVTSVKYTPNGQNIISASRDKTIKIWQLNGKLIQSWNAHNTWVNSIDISPDGKTIISGGEDSLVKIWRGNGQLIQTITGHQERINTVRFSPDGKIIATGGERTIKLWTLQGKLLHTLEGHTAPINSLSFNQQNQLVSADDDGSIKIWELDGTLITTITGQDVAVKDVMFLDNQTIISAGNDKTIRFWKIPQTNSKTNNIYTTAYHPNGKQFAAAGWDGSIKIWQQVSSKLPQDYPSQNFPSHQEIISTLSYSPDGKILASGGNDQNIKLWQTTDNILIKVLSGHQNRITSIAFSPNSELIASGSADKTVKLWRVADGKLLHTISAYQDEVTSVNFSPNGKLLAAGSADKTVKLWHLDGSLAQNLQRHGLAIASVQFSPNGKLIATASWDNTIKLWNVSNGSLIHNLTGHNNGVTTISFSPDGEILASGSADNTIKFWNPNNGHLVKTLTGYHSKINSLSFSPDGKSLLTGGEQTGVKLWDLNLDELLPQGCSRISNYLRHNPNLSQEERNICQGYNPELTH